MKTADNIIALKHKDTNVNVDGEILSLSDLEKIHFLYRLSCDDSFIANTLGLPLKKVIAVTKNPAFEKVVAEYLNEYLSGDIGESVEQLTLRYSEFFKEMFMALRVTVSLRIREHLEKSKPLDAKYLYIKELEKLAKLEFALHGLPIDIRGTIKAETNSQNKSDKELVKSISDINDTLKSINDKSFDPLKFNDAKVEDVKFESSDELECKEDTKPDNNLDPEETLNLEALDDETL